MSPEEREARTKAIHPPGLIPRAVGEFLARYLPGRRHRLAAGFLLASLIVFAWYDWMLRFIALLLVGGILLAVIRWRLSTSGRGGDRSGMA